MAKTLKKETMYMIDDFYIIFHDGILEVITVDNDLAIQPVVHNKVKIISTKL